MKQTAFTTGLIVLLMAAPASPSLAAKPTKTTPAPADSSPVVTPDTTAPPDGAAAPSGSVQSAPVGSNAAAPTAYTIPIGGLKVQPANTPAIPPPLIIAPPSGPAVMMRAQACLYANLARVLRAEPSAKLAVDLLLTDVCAEEVDVASQYVRNVEALVQFNPKSERGRAGLSTAHVDPETGQIVAPPNVDVSAAMEAASQGDLKIAASLRKYAAEMVLTEKMSLPAPANHPAPPVKKSH